MMPSGRAAEALAALPEAATAVAACALRRGLVAAGRPDLERAWTTEHEVARQLVRPLLDADHWPDPTPPLPVGPGAVHADLIDDDHQLLASLRAIVAAEGPLDPETLAARAQEWRLPVTPYRPLPHRAGPTGSGPTGSGPAGPGPTGSGPAAGGTPWSRPPLVVDLTSLWAGPLATSLLAALGARVVKVDPDCRPDGFRAHPRLYATLNGAKEIVDLDLRRDGDRRRFEALVARADLVVDSFSRRVMPNLGYGPDQLRTRNPAVATLSIVAFGAASPERHWVSYGPGVHAASGLGTTSGPDGRLRYRAAPIAYPDALAGLEAFAVAAEVLAGPVDGTPGRGPSAHREVSLAGALRPLVARAATRAGGHHG